MKDAKQYIENQQKPACQKRVEKSNTLTGRKRTPLSHLSKGSGLSSALFKNRHFIVWGALSLAVFATLFMVRLGLFQGGATGEAGLGGGVPAIVAGETYMAIFQNGRHIGFSHRILDETDNGYRIHEQTAMKVNTMGMVQDVDLRMDGEAASDLSLRSFDFEVMSGRFQFKVTGTVDDLVLGVTTMVGTQPPSPRVEIRLTRKPYLSALIAPAMAGIGRLDGIDGSDKIDSSDKIDVSTARVFSVFDPVTMGEMAVEVRVVGEETMTVMGRETAVRKLAIQAKGMTQYAFVDATGRVVKEEGLLGITLVAATRAEAIEGVVPGDDLTLVASVKPVWNIENQGDVPVNDKRVPSRNDRLKTLSRLTVVISGIDLQAFDLDGGRQSLDNNRLTITRERPEPGKSGEVSALIVDPEPFNPEPFLAADPLIQSDHPDIVTLARQIAGNQDDSIGKIRAVLTWMGKHIEKRPVVSLPNALSTLNARMGDCNEHAVLFAALCRSLGIPTRIEAGLVFLNNRFYYHAWNGVFLDNWTSVDALFNQFPADATHIRLSMGKGGEGFDLMGVIGRIKIEIVGAKP
ncbi:putative transglutaminase protein [Desulforapulum autotrophicum HRM2]|uniref:Transglutaminase protein n=1 Tax=Desulforapulum autotrophicum (strain ATCC 43914 / DSM 3382 / VKM B-1955 / HRM2) TaxID=177437 RepID=C0QMC8_DESAH|nr:putative transglutaminase protein [Desulforapulum autotrophicum HRM2]